MRKRIFVLLLCIISVGFYIISIKGSPTTSHNKIDISNVRSLTLNNKKYTMDENTHLISELVSMYNEAPLFKKDVGTTASHEIVIELDNGKKIDIWGTTQGFHYVTEGEKSYKISSDRLSKYLRELIKLQEGANL
ncbi:hypothetical protein JK636_14520 [Clostridium sp. YIM B02515]|uniref:Uncharacterized protein n=1 Tax=Clostridium rhizosphaerae TaxID=2803861 RepID=A0ABS1TC86_9CLOT|nr:hypothetical protein [Clostridium rhizosphaerae]MBL4936965.1 hypothetical protein [Clostridium rhizosphaerae]